MIKALLSFLFVFSVTQTSAQDFSSTAIDFTFSDNTTRADWSFEPLGPIMAFSQALDDTQDGLFIFRLEIKAKGFWPGTSPSFGIASYPLSTTSRHRLGNEPGEWGYLGSHGGKITGGNITPSWGLPVSDIGDQLAITYNTNNRALNFYTKRSNEQNFTHAGNTTAFTIPWTYDGTLRFAISIYSFRGCTVEIKQAEFVADNTTPSASGLSISGNRTLGEVLTGNYSYSDADNDTESGSTYQWYRSDDASGTNKTPIAGATNTTYTLSSNDLNKFISFEVTPNDGTVFGTAQESAYLGPVAYPLKLISIIRNNPTDSIITQSNLQFKLNFSDEVTNYVLSDFVAQGDLADSLTLNSVVYETDSSCLLNATLNSFVDGTIGIGIKGVGGLSGSNGIKRVSIVDTLSVNHLSADDYLNQAVIGQTYIATKENLKQVVIYPKSGHHSFNGTANLKIYSGDYSSGNHNLLYSESVSLTNSVAASGQTFELSNLVSTAVGNTYSITFENFSGSGSHAFESAISGNYSGGHVVFTGYNSSNHSGFDLKIKIIEAFQKLGGDLDTVSPLVSEVYKYTPPCVTTFSNQAVSTCNSYLWSQNNMTYTTSGMYNDTILNAAGCDSVITLDLTILNLSANITVDSLPKCFGSADGGLSLSASGGTSPLTYLWSNSVTTFSNNGISAGSYGVTVTDANGCSAVDSVIIAEPDTTIYSAQIVDVNCSGETNGSISVNVLSGIWPQQVNWSNGEVDSLNVLKAQDFEGNAADNWGYRDTTYLEDCSSLETYWSVDAYEYNVSNGTYDLDGRGPYIIYPANVTDVETAFGYNTVIPGSFYNTTYFESYASTLQDRINFGFFESAGQHYILGLFDTHSEDPNFRLGGEIEINMEAQPWNGNFNPVVHLDDANQVNISGAIDSADTYTNFPALGKTEFEFSWIPQTTDGFVYYPNYDTVFVRLQSSTIDNRFALLGYLNSSNGTFRAHKTRTDSKAGSYLRFVKLQNGGCVSLNNPVELNSSEGTLTELGNAISGANYLIQQNQSSFDTTARRELTFDPIQLDTASSNAISLAYNIQNLESDFDSVWYEVKYDSSTNWTNVTATNLDLNTNGWENLQFAIPSGEEVVHFRLISVTDDTNDLVAFDQLRIQSLTIGLDSIADGNYSFNAVDENGCTSSASFVVGFTNQSTASTQTEIACNSYLWSHNGMTYTSSGTYRDTIPNAAGCDSVITLDLTINNTVRDTNAVVACDSYVWSSTGLTYTTSGIYSDTLMAANGCDSIATIDLTINLSTSTTLSVTSCDSYLWSQNNMIYTASGMYNDTIPNAAGCDSVITLDLTINNTVRDTNVVTACDGYVWSSTGLTYTTSGIYSDTLMAANGCDSISSIDLTLNISTSSMQVMTSCDSYLWSQNNMIYTASGMYNDTIPNAAGCDSVITLDLTINNTVRDTNVVTACDSYVWASTGLTYTTSGIYSDTLMAANGCDSIASIDLTLNLSTSTTLSVTSCDSYLWSQNGMTYTTSGMYNDTIPNAAGCDSVITLDLTINNTVRDTNVVTACDGYVWSSTGLTYTTSGIYSDTLTAANGCDSISAIDLTLNLSTSTTLSVTSCDSYLWSQNGMTYTTSGMYNDTILNAAGCDSVITLDLTINHTVRDTNVVTACDSYVWASTGLTYTTSGIYSDTLTAANGCDSISAIDLTLNLSTSTTLSVTSCDSYLWSQNNMIYTASGMYNDTIPNVAGCDSVITLDLTINNAVRDTNAVVACDSYIWASTGLTYTNNGIYSDTLMAANGCDSIASIDLTLNLSTSTTLSVTSCDSYLWSQNGMTYTTSGMYNDTILNAAGCDSVITLDLTINNAVRDTNAVVACDSYIWASTGLTYTNNGIYSDTLMAANGCDSIASIDLTLNLSTSTTLSVTSCDSYLWSQNNMIYTASGMYHDTIPNDAGCDSVITLDLTIDTVDTRLIQNGFDLIAQISDPSATFQWIDCAADTAITGATSSTYTVTRNGSYSLEVYQNNCVDTSTCISVLNVGLVNIPKEESWFNLYPNPTKQWVNVEVSEIEETERIFIYNIEGSLVKEIVPISNLSKIELTDFASGIYFVRYKTETKKLIIRD